MDNGLIDQNAMINKKISSYPRRTAYKNAPHEILINIGAGSFRRKGWINLDFDNPHYDWDKDSFIQYDITEMKNLPYEDKSVKAVYISHVVEHIKNEHVEYLFREIRRVLKPDGIFRLAVPNADIYYLCMKTGETASLMWRAKFFKNHGWDDLTALRPAHYLVREICTARGGYLSLPSEKRRFDSDSDNPCFISFTAVEDLFLRVSKADFFDTLCDDLLFNAMHAGDHINWWTYEKAQDFLRGAGFSLVMPSSFLASSYAPMKEWPHFDSTRPTMSLYVEASP